jgi:hypothetical protein
VTGRNNAPDFPPRPPNCAELGFDAVLVNVDLVIAQKVKIGDALRVGLEEGKYPAAYLENEHVGGIASGYPGRLAECIREDGPFEATVLEADGALVSVRVRHL